MSKNQFDNIENLELVDYATELGDFLNGRVELQQIWDCYDVDNNGYIDDKEFHDLLYMVLAVFITQNAQEDDINEVPIPDLKDLKVTINNLKAALMPKLDVDKDGKISRDEFEKLGTYLLEEYDAIKHQKIKGGSSIARAAEEIYVEVKSLDRKAMLKMKGTTVYVGDQIISYESEDFVYFKVFYQLQGTILLSFNLWFKMVLLSLIGGVGFAVAHLLMNSRGFDIDGLRNFMGGLDALLAFFAGLYLAQILDRWWVMRSEGITGLVSAITDLSLALSGLLHEGTPEEENVKNLTLRYGLLTHALIYAEAQDRFISKKDDIWDELRSKGLVTYKEEKVLKNIRKKPEAVWGWILCYLSAMSKPENGLLPEDRFEHFAEICRTGRRACSFTALHIRCQLPLPYVHLICIVINLYQTILAFCSGLIISHAVRVKSDQEIVVQIVIFFLYCIIYQGILETADKMVNPLGTDDIDFPQLYIHLQVQDECRALYDASVLLPWQANKKNLEKQQEKRQKQHQQAEVYSVDDLEEAIE